MERRLWLSCFVPAWTFPFPGLTGSCFWLFRRLPVGFHSLCWTVPPFHTESNSSPVTGTVKEGSQLGEKKPYKIDREGGKGRSATAMGNSPVFVLPSFLHSFPPTPHYQASHAYSLCCSSPTLIHFHLCCFPSLLCTFPFCPPLAPPHTLSSPISLIYFTPCCPACSQPCCSPTHIEYLACFYPPTHIRRHTAIYPLCTSFHIQTHTRTELYKPWHIGNGLTSSKITFSSY